MFAGAPVPLFEWVAKPSEEFDGKVNKLDTAVLPGSNLVSGLKEFTIRTAVKL
jgi:hypothetical protein